MTRTGLFSSIQSSKHSGNNVLCPRSWPSTKRFISSPAYREGILTRESRHTQRFHTAWVIRYRSLRDENRSMSAMLRKRRLAVKTLSVAMGHVWTAPGWQELSSRVQQWSEQPCVRPVSAAHVTAGHNALRGSG